MSFNIYQVDAFTSEPFKGNPAGVCLLTEPMSEEWMQAVAAEMNLSETAFVYPLLTGYNLRWFTPKVEVDLCGHATLATAHVLAESGMLGEGKTARFETKSGILKARSIGSWIEMDFPVLGEHEIKMPVGLDEVLGIQVKYIGQSDFDLIVEAESEESIAGMSPDFRRLAEYDARGIIITARSSGEFDFVSRFFAPRVGIDEDPVTGSAHCVLGPFWQRRLGKDSFLAHQISKRGGVVRVNVNGDRVILGGQAVTVITGILL